METLVRAASNVDERISRLEQQVADYRDREKALTEALVTAQQMREDIKSQSTREVELLRQEAHQEAEQIHADAVRRREREEQALEGLRSRQFQFLASYRNYLEQELSEVSAMVQGLGMHTGRPPTPGPGGSPAPAAQPGTSSLQPPVPPPALSSDPDSPMPGTGEPEARSTVMPPQATPPNAAAAVPSRPDTRPVKPPEARTGGAAPTATAPHAGVPAMASPDVVSPDSQEAPLEEVLARWEPELDDTDAAPAGGVSADESAVDDDGDGLLLSADDVVAADAAADEDAATDDVEDEVDLAFLEFGDDLAGDESDGAAAARDAAVAEEVEREVSAAMVDSDRNLIDLGTALGDEQDEIELEEEVPESESASDTIRDEADEAIDAAFGFDDDPFDDTAGTRIAGPPPAARDASDATAPRPEPEGGSQRSDLDADIEFVDSLLMDAEDSSGTPKAVTDAPKDESTDAGAHALWSDPAPDAGSPGSGKPSSSGSADGSSTGPGDDSEGGAGEGGDDRDLIDLEAMRTRYEPPATGKTDTSSLTLHPMFFEEDEASSNNGDHEEARQEHWSSRGGG
jgi:hypothetical protein